MPTSSAYYANLLNSTPPYILPEVIKFAFCLQLDRAGFSRTPGATLVTVFLLQSYYENIYLSSLFYCILGEDEVRVRT